MKNIGLSIPALIVSAIIGAQSTHAAPEAPWHSNESARMALSAWIHSEGYDCLPADYVILLGRRTGSGQGAGSGKRHQVAGRAGQTEATRTRDKAGGSAQSGRG